MTLYQADIDSEINKCTKQLAKLMDEQEASWFDSQKQKPKLNFFRNREALSTVPVILIVYLLTVRSMEVHLPNWLRLIKYVLLQLTKI